jgi:hypothetical protein
LTKFNKKSTASLLATTAIFVLLGGISHAFAEDVTVQVPFDSHGSSCNFDEIAVEFHCVWEGTPEVYDIKTLEDVKELLQASVYEEELKQLQEEALAEIEAEKALLTPTELKIQNLEAKLDRGTADASDSTLYHLLKELDTCSQGLDPRVAPIQSERTVVKSSFDKWMYNNVDYSSGEISVIILGVEECRAQQKLLKVLGAGYANMLTGEDDYQFSLQDKYTPDIQAVNYDSLLATSNAVNTSLICDSNQHSQQYKKQFGCMMLYDGLSAEEIKRQNEIRFGTDGKIQYQSQVLDDYMDFMSNYGDRQASEEDKKTEEKIAEPLIQKLLESNRWYEEESP